jgi:site-specific DNA recombinase
MTTERVDPGTVAAYVRISVDDTRRAKGRARGMSDSEAQNAAIERQREDILETLAELGWTGEVHWYEERGVSAYDENVTRPAFERMLTDLGNGEVGAVIAYHADRLCRQHFDLERLLRIFRREAKAALLATAAYGREYDPRSEDGARSLRFEVDNAHGQSAATSRRVARKHRESARSGRRVGGARPFGWNASTEALGALEVAEASGDEGSLVAARARVNFEAKRLLDPMEAALVREAAQRVAAGETVAQICADWNGCGITTPRGSVFRRSTLVEILSNPALCGYRTHRGEIVEGPDGSPVVGDWTPILSVEEWTALAALVSPRWKRSAEARGSVKRAAPAARKHLFSGFLRCQKVRQDGAVCGTRMSGQFRPNGTYFYACKSKADGGCGGVTIDGPKADALLTDAVLTRLQDNAEASRAEVGPWDGAEELARLEADLREARSRFEAGRMSGNLYYDTAEMLEPKITALRRDRMQHEAALRAAEEVPVSLVSGWDGLTLEQKRVDIARVLRAVEVTPAVRGHHFRADRLTPIWTE